VVFFGPIGFSGIPYGHRSSDRPKGFEANLPCASSSNSVQTGQREYATSSAKPCWSRDQTTK
jgi:hypothetical protein